RSGRDADRADLARAVLHRRRRTGPRRGGAGALRRPGVALHRRRLGSARVPARLGPSSRRRLLRRRHRPRDLEVDGPDLGVPAVPAGDLARDGAACPSDRQAAEDRVHHADGREPLDPTRDHRARLRPLCLSADSRAGLVLAREGVRRGRGRPRGEQLPARVPGDPPERDLDRGRAPTPDDRDDEPDGGGTLLPLDRPLPVQYALMMKHMLISRDLISYGTRTKVVPEILSATPVTLSLVVGAAVIWVVFSIALGLAAAVLRGTIWDPLLMVLALIG